VKSGSEGTRSTLLAVAGVVVGILGVVTYFVAVLRFGALLPSVRNYAIPNLILIAVGLAISVAAFVRARRRILAGVLLGANVVVAAWFFAMLYVFSAVPPVSGPPIGSPAPSFALADQAGKTVRLEDFRGSPLLLVFYRGHW
jgi:hypothetical protein